jgi:hypothetical protein
MEYAYKERTGKPEPFTGGKEVAIKKMSCLLLLFILVSAWTYAQDSFPFAQLANPGEIFIDGDYIYITDFPAVYIYRLKDYKLLKKFGRKGEGPGEFRLHIRFSVQKDNLLVQSKGKVSLFTRQGQFTKQFRSPADFRTAMALGDRLVVSNTALNLLSDRWIFTVEICGMDFSAPKRIYQEPHFFQRKQSINVLHLSRNNWQRRISPFFYTYRDKIFIEAQSGENGTIHVFGQNGKKVSTITHHYDKLAFDDSFKQEIYDHFKCLGTRILLLLNKRKMALYPDYFPALRAFRVADGKIYVIPYKKKEGKSELHIFDVPGKLLGKVLVDIEELDIFEFYPFTISRGKIYQLVDNTDSEEWELTVKEL